MEEKLALLGGRPVRTSPWPQWPRADQGTAGALQEVLTSGRWSLSGAFPGTPSFERRFGHAFATFHDLPYAVPCASGTAALTIALEATGVRAGDEVLVPGLTWVACASAVAALNAIPLLVDVDPESLCMSLDAAEAVLTARTVAVLLVHSFGNIADIPSFLRLASRESLALVEDCSQAHGAIWNGQRVGSFGVVSAFSMQTSKLLTSGEGGCCLTSKQSLYKLLQQYRADGREYMESTPESGQMELSAVGTVQGHNYGMSEFHAAILLDRLPHLDSENRHRQERVAYLCSLLKELSGVTPVIGGLPADLPARYRLCLRLDRDQFGDAPVELIARALTCELGLPVSNLDNPLNDHLLYRPFRSPRITATRSRLARLDPTRFDLPVAARLRSEGIYLPHYAFLGKDKDMHDIAIALNKLQQHQRTLASIGRSES